MHGVILACALTGVLGQPPASAPQDPAPAAGPPQDAEASPPTRVEDVVVIGRRGAARVRPELELDAEAIDALGAYDIREVLARISETLGLAQPPVVIVNGRRAVDARNFLGFPPDALERIEALPPQAGALYGADPFRRVVNIVLQPNFTSRDALAQASRPTAGGTSVLAADARQSAIQDTDTRQIGVQASRTTALFADERPGHPRDNPGREGITLRPATQTVSANAALTGTVGDWSTALSADGQRREDRFVSTLDGGPAETRQSNETVSVNAGLGGQALGWSVRGGVDGLFSRVRQTGLADIRSRDLSMVANLSADRTLMTLSAGPVSAGLYGQYVRSRSDATIDAQASRGSAQALDLTGNLAVPLSRAAPEAAGGGWGDVSLTLGGRIRTLDTSDAQGRGLNAGLAWSPARKLTLNGQWARSTDGPTRQQRFDPILFGAPRTVYDFQTGEAVDILPLLGGNPDLRAQDSESATLSIATGPFGRWGLQGSLNAQGARSRNAIGSLPALSPAVEAAFPERFVRDGTGRLVSIDQRPINLEDIRTATVSSGLVANIPVGRGEPDAPRRGSLQIALNHSWQIENGITIGDGVPPLDLLAGDGGGIARHQVNLRLDGRLGKWGLNAAAAWRGPSRMRRDIGRDGPDDLVLDALATAGLKISRVFEALASAGAGAAGNRRDGGFRLEVEIDNLFDARPEARLDDGRPAPGYGRDDQDPLGRTVRATVSRRF